MVFLASFVLKEGAKGRWFWEIEMETTDDDLRRFRLNAADRQLESLKPKNGDCSIKGAPFFRHVAVNYHPDKDCFRSDANEPAR